MDYDALIDKWLVSAPPTESSERVEAVLVHFFGESSIKRGAGSSHQFRIKDSRLADLPGFGIGGHLTIPVSGGQKVKRPYLKRIAQAVKHIRHVEASNEERP
ncbi:MAG: hypothetical protein M1133_15670 [Armatimonadetes bacterium]|nr:hypothetical protein [Armatimonadota bacterium]